MNLRDALSRIYEDNGSLTPRLVVAAARADGDPYGLYSRFEWDDSVAGEKYREVQAQQLIRVVKVVETSGNDDSAAVRSFVSVQRPEGTSYVPVEEVRADPFTAKLVLQAAEREWRQMLARYRHLEEFLAIVRADVAS